MTASILCKGHKKVFDYFDNFPPNFSFFSAFLSIVKDDLPLKYVKFA